MFFVVYNTTYTYLLALSYTSSNAQCPLQSRPNNRFFVAEHASTIRLQHGGRHIDIDGWTWTNIGGGPHIAISKPLVKQPEGWTFDNLCFFCEGNQRPKSYLFQNLPELAAKTWIKSFGTGADWKLYPIYMGHIWVAEIAKTSKNHIQHWSSHHLSHENYPYPSHWLRIGI